MSSSPSPPPPPPPRPEEGLQNKGHGQSSSATPPPPPPSASVLKSDAPIKAGALTPSKSPAGPKATAASRFGRKKQTDDATIRDARNRTRSRTKSASGTSATKNAKGVKAATNGTKERNPLVPALIAGVLALAGAFLLVTSLRGSDATANVDETTSTVLVVKSPLEQGTTTADLLADPAAFLSAKAVPARYAAATAIGSIQQLSELGDMMLAVDILPGEQLLTGRFVERNDFERESYIDRSIGVEVPVGHHQVVLEIPAARALGGNIRPGDVVTVLSGFRVEPIDEDGAARRPVETSLVVLNAVEVLNVQIAGAVGELATDTDTVGIATTGDLNVTLAVTPNEITDLTYAIEYGDIILAVAIDETKESDQRSISVIDSILTGEDLVLDGSVPEVISNASEVVSDDASRGSVGDQPLEEDASEAQDPTAGQDPADAEDPVELEGGDEG